MRLDLSNELIAYIGHALNEMACCARTPEQHTRARRLHLEWTQAIESALRDERQREIDADREPSFLTKRQGGI